MTSTVPLDDFTVKFEIWDTAGQERYHSLAPMYYRGAQAAIVVYDITQVETFGKARQWIKELERQGDPGVLICLVGNKTDLEGKRQVSREEAQIYAKENGHSFMETSAKTGNHVMDVFRLLAERLPKNAPQRSRQGGVDLSTSANLSTDTTKCC